MNKTVRAAAVAMAVAGSLLAIEAQAQTSPWLVRVRAVNIDPANKDGTNPNLALSVNSKVIPEVDISYLFTPNLAAELILTYPQKHDIRSAGTQVGTLKHLPPTLTLQYRFTQLGAVTPYVGAGVNFTHFSNVEFDPAVAAALQPSIKKTSVGLALQAGVDIPLQKNWSLNLDVKKVQIRTDVSSFGTNLGTFKVDPLLVGVGVGYRF